MYKPNDESYVEHCIEYMRTGD